MKDAEVINCKSLGIRVDPTRTSIAENVVTTIKAGEHLKVNDKITVYSWDDKKFHPVDLEDGKKGYALVNCLKIGKEVRHE